ncbi:GNAT family N-acetyltransferase [Amycolatopsis suaedae]|uniref:GNAT family N-acetyltransferase n=1 Tax=Amycolatopsis suaedae TaxID=2510978 RepID=A0A4Q7JEA6_9PSEU|nr:GNAT family N-acetyltransferase [Amycolatopsis suaedae]RZQ65797.1 GNAT family N-acetyltransferase [Amycolatopsis suaedae]
MSELVRSLQERTARAVPARHVSGAGGWWLRHDAAGSWWAGSVLPHHDAAPAELPGRIAHAERFYAGHGATACFQISPGACPATLDAALAARGYVLRSPMSLRTATTATLVGEPRHAVRLDDHPAPDWMHVAGAGPAEREVLDRIRLPAAYATAVIGGTPVAVGRAVADTGWAGVFGMATLPEARGRGAARAVLAALAGWARDHAADRMYLQVEPGNTAAERLYDRLGFTEICAYHYRTTSPTARPATSSPAATAVTS